MEARDFSVQAETQFYRGKDRLRLFLKKKNKIGNLYKWLRLL
jgi:hypothetical protein